jgi:hypothetical protein
VPKGGKHLGFPKVVIFELVETQNEYPKFFIRIYERRALDAKIKSKNVYMYIKGEYITATEDSQKDDDDMFKVSMNQEVSESISSIEVF